MSKPLPVVAAIPNFNMANQLKRLLPQVIAQHYDAVYVLDDASTDGSKQVVTSFGPQVTLVAGEQNLSSSGNRNRILGVLHEPAIIHFIDADVELDSQNIPETIRGIMSDPRIGLGGGLVVSPEGRQSIWNYGPGFSVYSGMTAALQAYIEPPKHPKLGRLLRHATPYLLSEWPDTTRPPQARPTFWVHEANMFMRSDIFAKLGGFDIHVREHDIQDLAIRVQKAGLITMFDPAVAVIQHNDVNVRPGNRRRARRQAVRYISRKNGRLQRLFPGGRFKPRQNR